METPLTFGQVVLAAALGNLAFILAIKLLGAIFDLINHLLDYLFPRAKQEREAIEAFEELKEKLRNGNAQKGDFDSIEKMAKTNPNIKVGRLKVDDPESASEAMKDMPADVLRKLADEFRVAAAQKDQEAEDHFYNNNKEEENE